MKIIFRFNQFIQHENMCKIGFYLVREFKQITCYDRTRYINNVNTYLH